MSRKAAGKDKEEEQHDAEVAESKRLFEASTDLGLLSRTRRLANNSLPPTKLMVRSDGKDIVKKASSRKGRYLLVFNFQLAPAAAGKLGTLSRLDSKNPLMYIDFPQGRYKMFGTLVFPRNKYVVLRLGQKEVVCEDVLESMVVFSEGWWIGTAEENPEETRLPEPDWLVQPALHQKYDFTGRGAAGNGAGAGKEAEAIEVTDEEEEDEPASQRPQRKASRAAGGKRLRYNEDSDGGEAAAEDSDSDEEAPRKLQRLGSQLQRQQRKVQAKQQPESHPLDLVDSEDEMLGVRRSTKQQGTLDAFVRRGGSSNGSQQQPRSASKVSQPAPTTKPKPALASGGGASRNRRAAAMSESGDDEDYVDLARSSGSDGEDEAPPSSARPRSLRKAASIAAKKLTVVDEDEIEDAVPAASVKSHSSAAESSGEDASSLDEDSDGGGSDYLPSD